DAAKARQALKALGGELDAERVQVQEDVCLVGVIGEAVKSTPGVVGKVGSCLGKAGLNIEAVSQGASEIDMLLVVKERHRVQAVQALHRALVEGKT
ncbi:MAG TPA: ACT domain-containing protein, partial [Candidatus Diapherotrites archaeon]|nr:ACT domain-containing protein [Candidatus Diapherotrites archaeon]